MFSKNAKKVIFVLHDHILRETGIILSTRMYYGMVKSIVLTVTYYEHFCFIALKVEMTDLRVSADVNIPWRLHLKVSCM